MHLHRYKTTISCIIILFIFILYTISCICCSFSTPHPFAPTISCVCLCLYHSILCRYYILYSMYLLPLYLVPRSSSPLRPSSTCILHSIGPYCTPHSIRADRVDPISRPREPHSLAVLGRPIKVHWPTHSRVISRILLYIVLYTIHQPQYIVVSNWAMNMCILYRYLRYNILCYKATTPTIYSNPWETARFAVYHAVYTLCGKLHHYNNKLRDNADIAPLSRDFALCACVVCCAYSS